MVDPPWAQALDCAPNEGGYSPQFEILGQLGEILTEVQEMAERSQSQDADASTEAQSYPTKMQMVSAAIQ